MGCSRFLTDDLRDKALLALEDAIQECRYRTPRPSYAVRFALAYLWVCSGGEREPFDEFWRSMRASKTPWSFSGADGALTRVYRALGLERPDAVSWEMWQRWSKHEGNGGSQ